MLMQRLRFISLVAAAAMILGYVALLGGYLVNPIFFDHAEVQFPAVSWYFIHGHPLYNGLSDPEWYAEPYGPFAYAAQGLAMTVLGPSVFSAKLAGVAASLLVLAMAYLAARQYASRELALIVVGFLAAYWIGMSFTTISSRNDVWLLLFAIIGFWACARPGWTGAVIIAVALGLSMNLKIHGPLYLLPVAGVALRRGMSWAKLFAVAGIAWLIFLLPFGLLPNMSLGNFVAELALSPMQGLDAGIFLKDFAWMFLMLAPLLAMVVLSQANNPAATRNVLRRNWLTLAALVVSTTLVMLIAAKPGSGAPHLLPLSTVTVLASLQLWRDGLDLTWRPSRWGVFAAILVVGAMVCCFSYGFFKIGEGFWSLRPSLTRRASAIEADTQDILRREGSGHLLLMGLGDANSYSDTFFRCQLVFGGMPIGLSTPTVMNRKLSHIPLPSLNLLRDSFAQRYPGKSIIWLIPKGAVPFSFVYDDKFRADFNLHYVRFESTPCFDLYGERAIGH